MQTTEIPAGFRQDTQGRLVPEAHIKPIDLMRDQLVQQLVQGAMPLREQLVDYRAEAFADIQAFIELSAEQFHARVGGAKGNVTLVSYDGRYKVQRAVAETIVFDERLQAAKALIDDCLREWTTDARPEVAMLVQDAFRVDASGQLRTGSVLGLRRLHIEDKRWSEAMRAIADAITVIGKKTYLRIYERDALGRYQPISLDIASADRPATQPAAQEACS